MNPITITKEGQIIAHHTTDSSMSHYGQPVWTVEDSDPGEGRVIWSQGDNQVEMDVLGVVGGWLVAKQPDGLWIGIIWSDGDYYANVIDQRGYGRPAPVQTTIEDFRSGQFVIRDTLAGFFDEESPLGCLLFIPG